ncbi:serine/threonine protein kinase [Candidatus Bathyarchaeota archaeon]|nr:serine/threonine protein kinase [Candidatus Bathyarchaeota archaeon]
MSMDEFLTGVFRRLEPEDFRVLTAVELGMVSHAYTPIEDVVKYSSLPREEVLYRVKRLNGFRLIRGIVSPFEGYVLNYYGYDFLALNALVKAGKLEALGKSVGIGKEADVFEGLTSTGEKVIVKFHRVGRVSFRQTRRVRRYIADRRHISWLYQSRKAAEKEFEALEILNRVNAKAPKPLAQNRHVVVMGFFSGVELVNVKSVDEPLPLFRDIVDEVKQVYFEAGLIHGDLSEYNIIIKEDGDFMLIDWPQFIRRIDPESEHYLKRDLEKVTGFFNKRFNLKLNTDRVLNYVLGSADDF